MEKVKENQDMGDLGLAEPQTRRAMVSSAHGDLWLYFLQVENEIKDILKVLKSVDSVNLKSLE